MVQKKKKTSKIVNKKEQKKKPLIQRVSDMTAKDHLSGMIKVAFTLADRYCRFLDNADRLGFSDPAILAVLNNQRTQIMTIILSLQSLEYMEMSTDDFEEEEAEDEQAGEMMQKEE